MSAKFIRRTLRNVVLRNRPYFAHLALTHKCNLRCRFCHIQETQFEELDTASMKRAIDVLDQIGVGVLSISGGGEPLLRNDFDLIINHAAGKGLYTKITSNGTMPRDRYDRLLASGIREISISLDGVEGNDLPFSHTGPAILRTIRHLHDHLPVGKQLTLNVTVTDANRAQIPNIVAYCAREYPNAKVWLNPVVTGTGKLRSLTQIKVDPAAAEACDSPTLLRAPFYDAGVREQYQREVYDWGCRAGELFFDVKPNGDVWACQDQPAQKPLNVLEPDFAHKLHDADFRTGASAAAAPTLATTSRRRGSNRAIGRTWRGCGGRPTRVRATPAARWPNAMAGSPGCCPSARRSWLGPWHPPRCCC